ncbi:hypothetical protein CWB96_00190 [Pseudoalteromonas citrea]|uniref:Uncharacterized protein n=1 Tax=Pseudoalteromonas citrea TaxID=43655 RepID=A0A5S3XX97_9GAMM|nr:hypothetical protein [Pseudoalteromonas citrea]TMP46285.1 hypothetical protein CWB97_02185 [Pseudoalteromonas citrea]TMP63061.1 hypothetical protein CWB96_00190 [Pseudoalteromonas citrea]
MNIKKVLGTIYHQVQPQLVDSLLEHYQPNTENTNQHITFQIAGKYYLSRLSQNDKSYSKKINMIRRVYQAYRVLVGSAIVVQYAEDNQLLQQKHKDTLKG